MERITFYSTKKKQVLDITDKVQTLLTKKKIKTGLCHLFILHTTACLTTAYLDPGTDLDLLDALEAIIPKLKYHEYYGVLRPPSLILSDFEPFGLSEEEQRERIVL